MQDKEKTRGTMFTRVSY
ncbi:Protein of unknown function [Bacillus cytotoxicus]|nr:Protein of unknown function [Bacillus cytotoxicus]